MDSLSTASMSHYADLLCRAILKKQRVRFEYNGKLRIGEPQCFGLGDSGNELVRVNLINPQQEKLFTVEKMGALELLDQFFSEPGPNYNPKKDAAIKEVYARL